MCSPQAGVDARDGVLCLSFRGLSDIFVMHHRVVMFNSNTFL